MLFFNVKRQFKTHHFKLNLYLRQKWYQPVSPPVSTDISHKYERHTCMQFHADDIHDNDKYL